MRGAEVAGWGGGPSAAVTLVRPEGLDQARDAIRSSTASARGAIARGLGRSYGDAAQLADGLVIDTRGLLGVSLDRSNGTVTAQAGVTIGELLGALVPSGWMVPVVPGTQHVTVGGAIASDIHGKNHGAAGTFSRHVEALSLLISAGEVLQLTPGDELFAATVGGMGLTGVIVSARIKLLPISGPLLAVDTDRVDSLDDALAALRAPGGPYRVAWLDLLGGRPGRGIVTRAEHAEGGDGSATVKARATVPRRWAAGALRPSTVRAYNALRFSHAPRSERGKPEAIARHMFPLDALDSWPRLYGRAGLLQYQLVVPTGAESVLAKVIDRLRHSRVPCYLAVLKDFGRAGPAPLSFPIEGWTLALDLPGGTDDVELLLDGYDELVAEAGGRVYLTKDARLKQAALDAMYPRLDEWRAAREQADPGRLWRSDLALRVGLL